MANETQTIKDANDEINALASYSHITELQLAVVEKDLKEQKIPLQSISTTIEIMRRDAKAYRGTLSAPEKLLKEVRKFSSPGAVAAAKKLEAALKVADKVLTGFENTITLYDKVWQKCWEAEKRLRLSLDKGIDSARDQLKVMSVYARSLTDQAAALHTACANKQPEQRIKPLMDALINEVKACGAAITTAQSVVSWINTVLKDRGAAFHPEVGRLADEADKLQDQLGKSASLAKAQIGKALGEIKDARAVVA